jgi:hypothetical protein
VPNLSFDGCSSSLPSSTSSLSLWDGDERLDEWACQWMYEFRVVLGRATTQYYRNWGNVMVRLLLMAVLGFIQVRLKHHTQPGFQTSASLQLISTLLRSCRASFTCTRAARRAPTRQRP